MLLQLPYCLVHTCPANLEPVLFVMGGLPGPQQWREPSKSHPGKGGARGGARPREETPPATSVLLRQHHSPAGALRASPSRDSAGDGGRGNWSPGAGRPSAAWARAGCAPRPGVQRPRSWGTRILRPRSQPRDHIVCPRKHWRGPHLQRPEPGGLYAGMGDSGGDRREGPGSDD